MPKKKKQIQITGKKENFIPTRLDQILGDFNEHQLYGTKDEDEYTNRLTNMTEPELQEHAIKLGLVPSEDRDFLVKNLVKGFRTYLRTLYQPIPKQNQHLEVPDNIQKILDEQKNKVVR